MVDRALNRKKRFIKKINDLDDNTLNLLNQYLNKLELEEENKQKKMEKISIDKATEKYQLLLKYVNGILENMDQGPIEDLTDFKAINRQNIATPKNIDLLNEMAPQLFKHFNKYNCGYYRRTKNKALNCLRGMCKELGLKLIFKQKSVTKNCKIGAIYLYSIEYN